MPSPARRIGTRVSSLVRASDVRAERGLNLARLRRVVARQFERHEPGKLPDKDAELLHGCRTVTRPGQAFLHDGVIDDRDVWPALVHV